MIFQNISDEIYAAAVAATGDDVLKEVLQRGWYSEDGELRYLITQFYYFLSG